jgi:hypothetical protein
MRCRKMFMALLAALSLVCTPLFVMGANSAGEDLKFVTTDELKAMFDAGESFLLINALSPLEFTQTKIKGSKNIPYSRLRDGKEPLPEDKGVKLIFYCKGPK